MSKDTNSLTVLSDRIQQTIERLRSLSQETVQSSWHIRMEAMDETEVMNETEVMDETSALESEGWSDWEMASLNNRNHIAWPKGRHVFWLAQRLRIPPHLNGYALDGYILRLSLTWWAEDAQIFVNGKRVQCGDLYDCSARIVLAQRAIPETEVVVAIRLVSPGHDDGALVKSVMVYESSDLALPEPGFVADELAVLSQYLKTFAPERLELLAQAVDEIPWDIVHNRDAFDGAIAQLRTQLQPFSHWLKQRTITLLGHAHLDLAWLWPIPETWDVAQRTFESVLNLQQDYPDLIFGHSTPMLYEWMEQHRPDIFAQIQTQVQKERWEAIAGLWVEPELNVVGGESIVRQVLYGQRYCQEKLGQISRVAWLPDTFGFCWQLPQILSQGGIDYFITQKLRWNDTTEFPHELFEWRSPDGTSITSLMSAPIGTTIDPVQMAEYACTWEQSTGHLTSLWLPGVGDHGGGPTRDMIELAHRWQRSPFFPILEFGQAIDFLDGISPSSQGSHQTSLELSNHDQEPRDLTPQIPDASIPNRPTPNPSLEGDRTLQNLKSKIQNSSSPSPSLEGDQSKIQNPLAQRPEGLAKIQNPSLPVWTDELYLELHRGCYTAHADQKQWNRQGEALLYEAELWSSLATMITGADYPKQQIEQTWKTVLFNQFHDILPGSSIPEVYEEVNPQWQQAIATSTALRQTALDAIAPHIILPSAPTPDSISVVIFNPLNWSRTDVVKVLLPPHLAKFHHWSVQTPDGTELLCQYCQSDTQASDNAQRSAPHVLIVPPPVPGIGYTTCWLTPTLAQPENHVGWVDARDPNNPWLENAMLRVTIDSSTGEIQQIYDKTCNTGESQAGQRPVLTEPGNRLLAFRDEGEYWDAWNIAPDYLDHPLPGATLEALEWISRGPVEQRLRIVRQLGNSRFIQDYVLWANSSILRIESVVEWRDRHTVVKAAFPFTVTADHATYDMPFGAIQRPTHPQTPAEKAKWEVPGLAWADLTGANLTEVPLKEGDESRTASNESHYGVSILSDYKHGYSSSPSELRLTLLRGPTWPDPESDQGLHSFVYALYPHAESWQAARTVHHSYELRHPLQTRILPKASATDETRKERELPAIASLLTLSSDHFIVSAVKQSEERQDDWIVRGYECHGQAGVLTLNEQHAADKFPPTLNSLSPATLLEANGSETTNIENQIQPWGVHTWQFQGP